MSRLKENLLCFTLKLWHQSASDSASINLCCLSEIVSTSLSFQISQIEISTVSIWFPFFVCAEFSHLCEMRNYFAFRLFHFNISSLYLWAPPQCSGLQAEGCWAFNLSNIQTFHFTSRELFLKIVWNISLEFFEIFLLICVKYFLQEQEVVSEALWIGGLAWSVPGLWVKLQTTSILNPKYKMWQK